MLSVNLEKTTELCTSKIFTDNYAQVINNKNKKYLFFKRDITKIY